MGTGEVIGAYEVEGELGKGTAGRVVRARQRTLDRVVALKLLDPRVAKDKTTFDRFMREARALAPLRHPNVASLIDVGQDPTTGQHYIAFELVQGPSVEALIAEQGALPEDEAVRIAHGVAEGLTCAEQHRVVHRDVQPANILIAPDGTPKLIDMGLAKRLDESGSITVGGLITTPHYVSPEQAMELDSLDVRADLYALGISLYRMVTGKLPFAGDGFLEVVTRHINEDVPDPRKVAPGVSAHVAAVIAGLCARDREARYPTARAAANDLQRVRDGDAPLGPLRAAEPVVRSGARSGPRSGAYEAPSRVPVPAARGADPGSESGELLAGVPFRIVVTTPDGPLVDRIYDQPVVTIGRDPACDLHINDKTVSRRHAELLRNGPSFALSARETANGTFVNERQVKELVLLAPTDEVRIAEKFRVRVTAQPRDAQPPPAAPAAPPARDEETSELERPAPRVPREAYVDDPADDAAYRDRQAAKAEAPPRPRGSERTPARTTRPAEPPAARPGAAPPDEDDPYGSPPTPAPAAAPAASGGDDDPYRTPAAAVAGEDEIVSPFARGPRAAGAPRSPPPKASPPRAEPTPAPRTPKEAPRAPTAGAARTPAPKAEAPAPKAEAPAPKAEAPAPKAEAPAPKAEAPAAKAEAPAAKAKGPALKTPAPKAEAPAARAEAAKAEPPARPARPPVDTTPFLRAKAPARAPGPEALVFHREGAAQRVALGASFVVGRGPGCDLVLRHPFAPRAAALVVRSVDGPTLFNTSPSPATVTVNGKPVAGEHRLAHGDAIDVYGARLTFEARGG